MRTPDELELENMALAAELARQVCHDVNNFVYNFFLQIEITETKPDAKGVSWEGVKREADKLVATLREWDRYHERFANAESNVDLHDVIQRVAADVSAQGQSVGLGSTISKEPLMVNSAATTARHLLRMLIEDAANRCQAPANASIETAKTNSKALVRILTLPPSGAAENEDTGANDEGRPMSLMAAACRSLAIRLDVTIHWEQSEDGRQKIQVEFPLASTK